MSSSTKVSPGDCVYTDNRKWQCDRENRKYLYLRSHDIYDRNSKGRSRVFDHVEFEESVPRAIAIRSTSGNGNMDGLGAKLAILGCPRSPKFTCSCKVSLKLIKRRWPKRCVVSASETRCVHYILLSSEHFPPSSLCLPCSLPSQRGSWGLITKKS